MYMKGVGIVKNVLIGVFAGISVISLGYIAYDSFIKEDNIQFKECNKEEICDDNLLEKIDNSDNNFNKLEIYNGLDIPYNIVNMDGTNTKIETKSDGLYVNDKLVSENYMRLYVTDKYIFTCSFGLAGVVFHEAIDKYGNIINLEDMLDPFQAYVVYLTDGGNINAVGLGEVPDINSDMDGNFTMVEFSIENNELKIEKNEINVS